MGVFSHFLVAFPGLLAIHWSYGTRHVNEKPTHFCLVLLQKEATKCSSPEVYPILSQTHQKTLLGDFFSGNWQLPEDLGCKRSKLQNNGFRPVADWLRKVPHGACYCPMHFPICVCQWLHGCTSTWLQRLGDNLHELAAQLGNFSITVFFVGGVAPSVIHLIRSTGPQNWEMFKKCLQTAEIHNIVAKHTIFEESAPHLCEPV